MKHRCRASEAGSVEAGSPAPHRFFLLIASLGQSLGHSFAPNRASQERSKSGQEQPQSLQERPRAAQERQERPQSAPREPQERPRAPQSAPRTPKSTPRTSQERPQSAKSRQPGLPGAHRNAKSKHPGDLHETLPLRSEINENTAPAQQNRRPEAPQPERPAATRTAISSQPGRPKQPDRATRGQIEPARRTMSLGWSPS